MKNLIHNKKAFSLIEVLIAIFIISIGITGAVSLISYSISAVAISKSQIITANLAQEGLEIVRNIRDSNWLKDSDWNNGLGNGDYRVQYNSQSLLAFSDTLLQINSNGFYGYNGIEGFSGGVDTLFKRKITITNISNNEIRVVSEITWRERGRSFVVSAESRLYDWK